MKKRLPVNIDDLGLTPREIKFVGEYITNGYKVEEAMKTAGLLPEKSPSSICRIQSAKLLSDTRIREAIRRIQGSFIEPYRDIHYAKLQEVLEVRAFYDISDYRNPDGSFKPLDQIPYKLRYAIDDVKERWYMGKNGVNELCIEFTMADRKDAMKQLRELHELKEKDKDAGASKARDELFDLVSILKDGVQIGARRKALEIEENKAEVVPAVPASEIVKQIKDGSHVIQK